MLICYGQRFGQSAYPIVKATRLNARLSQEAKILRARRQCMKPG
jgi:hypothetical protein